MNFCTSCGAKIKKNDLFCTKCGTKILTKEEIKQKEDKKRLNVILMLGVFLVLFSTFALGIFSWKSLGSILKVSFFGFECLLFFGLSLLLKKTTESKFYRVFYVIGLILIPYTLSLIPYYGLLSDYFNKGPGVYVYLAIIYFISFIIFLLLNHSFKSQVVNFISLLLLLASFIFCALIFNNNFIIYGLIITLYTTFIFVLSHVKLFSDSFRKIMKIFVYVLMIIDFMYLIVCFINNELLFDKIINSISLILYLGTGYFIINKNEKNGFSIAFPFLFSILSLTFIYSFIQHTNYYNANDYDSMYRLLGTSLITLILFFISLCIDNKPFKDVTFVITYIILAFIYLIGISTEIYLGTFILTIIVLLVNLFNIFILKKNYVNNFIAINTFLSVYSLSKLTINLNISYIAIIISFIFLLVYSILKIKKNKYSISYLLTTLILDSILIFSIFEKFDIYNIGIIFVFLAIFVLSNIFKEDLPFKIVSFIMLNISSISFFSTTGNPLYYGLLTMSGLTLVFSLLINKYRKIDVKQYILYSEIVIFVITLLNNLHFPSYILFINVFVYAIGYMSLIKFFNYKWWRLSYILLGLFTITRIINILVEPIVIASILSIVIILIILTIMYLLEMENNISLTLLSLIILYPYYNLVINTYADVSQLYLMPVVIYTIVFTEVIKFKDSEDKKAFTIIPLTAVSIAFVIVGEGVSAIICNVCISLVYIILGLYRKYNYLLYFGVIFIIATLIVKLFTVLNSLLVVILLIIIGFILIGTALFVELKKKK